MDELLADFGDVNDGEGAPMYGDAEFGTTGALGGGDDAYMDELNSSLLDADPAPPNSAGAAGAVDEMYYDTAAVAAPGAATALDPSGTAPADFPDINGGEYGDGDALYNMTGVNAAPNFDPLPGMTPMNGAATAEDPVAPSFALNANLQQPLSSRALEAPDGGSFSVVSTPKRKRSMGPKSSPGAVARGAELQSRALELEQQRLEALKLQAERDAADAVTKLAASIVHQSWTQSLTPLQFAYVVRTSALVLPPNHQTAPPSGKSSSAADGAVSDGAINAKVIASAARSANASKGADIAARVQNIEPLVLGARESAVLPPDAQSALVDAICVRLCSAAVPSARLVAYLRELLMVRAVSSSCVMRSIVKCCTPSQTSSAAMEIEGEDAVTTPELVTASEEVKDAFLRLLAQMLPWYSMSPLNGPRDVQPEIEAFLPALGLILGTFSLPEAASSTLSEQTTNGASEAAAAASSQSVFLRSLMDDRIIALARACGRRSPALWEQIEAQASHVITCTSQFMQSAGRPNGQQNQAGNAVLVCAKQWQAICLRLRDGLAAGVATPFSATLIQSKAGQLTLLVIMEYVLKNTKPILGESVTLALREFWAKKEPPGGDLESLKRIESAASALHAQSEAALGAEMAGAAQNGEKPKYSFREQFRMCEMFVKQFSEASTIRDTHTDRWLNEWGGRARLGRLLRDVLPQIRGQLRTVYSCLMVATAVIAVSSICCGPSLVQGGVAQAASVQLGANDELDELTSILGTNSVDCLREAALAEEPPANRSFGLWLMRLASRSGALLRLSKCNYALAVRVLRSWEVINGGKPFTDTAFGRNGVELPPSHPSIAAAESAASGNSSGAQGSKLTPTLSSSSAVLIVDAADNVADDTGLRLLCTEPVQ